MSSYLKNQLSSLRRRAARFIPANRPLQDGFTMVELLVTMAIVSIVAAILFPIFATAREKARQSSCLSNMRQIGMALMMYTNDNDDRFPQANFVDPDSSSKLFGWENAIGPYITGSDKKTQEDKVWHCPSFPVNQQGNYGTHHALFPHNDVAGAPINPTYPTFIIPSPADTVLIAEKGQENTPGIAPSFFETAKSVWVNPDGSDASVLGKYDRDTAPPCPALDCNNGPYNIRYRHSGVVNVIFADGHAKGMPKGTLGGQAGYTAHIYIPDIGMTP